jgi:RNA polymerase sigma-B factor
MPTASPARPRAAFARAVPARASDDPNELFERWRECGERSARDALAERFMPLARKLARRYIRSSEPLEDLVQVANLALLKAIDRFDPTHGNGFQAFAVPTILGELRRYFRDSGWALHVPRAAQERALEVEAARERLTARHGRAPTVGELAQYLEHSEEEVLQALQVEQAYATLSLDATRKQSDEEEQALADTLGSEDERFELIEADVSVVHALSALPERERMILRLRFIEDMTQSEIATAVGLSQMQISRLLRRSLERLRKLASADEADDRDEAAAPKAAAG